MQKMADFRHSDARAFAGLASVLTTSASGNSRKWR
jgi:hypothetical protein